MGAHGGGTGGIAVLEPQATLLPLKLMCGTTISVTAG